MGDEDKIFDKLKELTGKIDKKALAGAVGLMCLSWGALIPVYYLLTQRNAKESKSREMEKMRDKSKETETSENS